MSEPEFTISCGIDYSLASVRRAYEYCVFRTDAEEESQIVARKGGFSSNAMAKRHGLIAAYALQAAAVQS